MADHKFLISNIHRKLRRLRGALRRRLAGEAVCWLVLALVAAVFVTLGFDYALRLDRTLRGVIVGLSLAGVAAVAWRQLVAPLRVPMNTAQLALLVERQYEQFGGRLISAVQFDRALSSSSDDASGWKELAARKEDSSGQKGTRSASGASLAFLPKQSAAMMLLVIDQAARLAGDLDFRRIVDRTVLRRQIRLAACAAAILLGFCLWQGRVMRLWLRRNVAFANVAWPQAVYLDVTGAGMDKRGDFRVLRGEDLSIEITARPGSTRLRKTPAPAPPEITLHAYYRSVGWTEDQIALAADGLRIYTRKFSNVSEPFTFYVTGGDDHRKITHHVRLIDPPGLIWLRFGVNYPRYMKRTARVLDASGAVLVVPPGSWISLSAGADKDLRRAEMLLDGQKVADMEIHRTTRNDAADNERVRLAGRFQVPVTGAVQGPGKSPMRTLRIALLDTDGFANRSAGQYKIRVEPDLPPRLTLKKRGVGAAVTAVAVLPLMIRVRDDNGVAQMRAVAAWSGRTTGGTSWVVTGGGRGKAEFAALHQADLKDLGLKPGMTVRLHAEADDFMPADLGGPNTGRSGVLTFRIVKRDELLAEMVRRQKILRAELEQAVRTQEDSIAKTYGVIAILGSGRIAPAARRQLRDAVDLQIAVGGECAKVAEALQAVLTEMTCNRIIEAKGSTDMSEGIIAPLKSLTARIEKLAAQMQTAEKAKVAAAMLAQTAGIDRRQREVLAEMRIVLERMVKIVEAQELAYKLERLIERWDKVIRDTEQRSDAEIGDVFEPTSRPARPVETR